MVPTADQQEALIVQNWKGEYVGAVTDVLLDTSGNIRFIIVSIGDRMGKREIAVPTACFSANNQRKLLLNVSKEKLAAAPKFDAKDLTDPAFAEKVYRFFGLTPAWTERPPQVEM